MSYPIEISKALTETLARFVSLNAHQLAGHAANLDFWLGEVKHCIEVIEGYRRRFEVMKAAQMAYVAEKRTMEFSYRCEGYCPICAEGESALPPRPIPEGQLREALRALRDAAYHFLVRCYRTDFFDETRLRQAADSVGTGIDVGDLKR